MNDTPTNTPDEADMFNDPEYQAFVDEVAKECRCFPLDHRPCEGLLAGGPCDHIDWGDDDDD